MSKEMFGGFTIEVKGLEETINRLHYADPKLERAFKKGLKEAVEPVLEKARSRAHAIADDGTFAGSLSIGSRANGSQYVLKATDANAGVKEFANFGATGRTARWRGKRVGVPHRANKPRAMVPAVEESEENVRSRIEQRLQEVLDEVSNG